MEPRRLVTSAQVSALLSYVEEHGDLVLGKDRTASGRAACRRKWDDCAEFVNRQGEPRSGKDWAKYWSELKCRVKAKLGSSSPVLTTIEERVAVFVRQNTSADSTTEEKDNTCKEDQDDDDDEAPLVISLTPPRSPRSPCPPQSPRATPAEVLPSPKPATTRSSGTRGRSQMTTTRATQYSPSPLVNSLLARLQERHARIEERRRRMEERRTRLEERRANTSQLLAEAVLQRAEAAVVQAEAARTQAHALKNISNALQQLVDVANGFSVSLNM